MIITSDLLQISDSRLIAWLRRGVINGVTAGEGAKAALKVKVQDGPELYVCRLQEGRQDFANLDLVLDEYTEFTVEGAALHITGATNAAVRICVAVHAV